MAKLDEAISAYQAALASLSAQTASPGLAAIISVLLARDDVSIHLAESRPVPQAALDRIVALDQTLKAAAPSIASAMAPGTLDQWRDAHQPAKRAWWWRLDQPAPNPLWSLLAVVLIMFAVSLAVDISLRFLRSGADSLAVLTSLVQIGGTVLAGSALTGAGQELSRRFFSRRASAKALPALLLLLAVGALRLSLPAIARSFNECGVNLQQQGLTPSAIRQYERAVSLNPDYAQAHYNLATAYEDILRYEDAISEYQTAIRIDSHLYLAYNNLAHLYLVHGQDDRSALHLLTTALRLPINLPEPQRLLVLYSFLKNSGWANLGLGYLGQAEANLRDAIALRPQGAAAHCLLAQTLEAQGKPQAALASWDICFRYETDDVVEPEWLSLAKERLAQGVTK